MILEPKKIKSVTVSIFSPFIFMKGWDCMPFIVIVKDISFVISEEEDLASGPGTRLDHLRTFLQ